MSIYTAIPQMLCVSEVRTNKMANTISFFRKQANRSPMQALYSLCYKLNPGALNCNSFSMKYSCLPIKTSLPKYFKVSPISPTRFRKKDELHSEMFMKSLLHSCMNECI